MKMIAFKMSYGRCWINPLHVTSISEKADEKGKLTISLTGGTERVVLADAKELLDMLALVDERAGVHS